MQSTKPLSIMVSAGEASGDSHASHALQALTQTGVSFTSFGMGADALQASGTELIVDCRDLAVIGIVDVVLNYHKFTKRLKQLRSCMAQRKPDLLLIVDYPDFNLKLAETARALGIPVLFYISPKVWAWRAGRVKRIASLVSHIAVLFPFEVEIYEHVGLPVTYVGNPVVHDAVSAFSRDQACAHLGLNAEHKVIALLPGSRTGEIRRHMPAMLETAGQIQQSHPDIQFVLPVAPTLDRSYIDQTLKGSIGSNVNGKSGGSLDSNSVGSYAAGLLITDKDSRDVMRSADVALVASGTATLETALVGTPMVVMYIVNAINYAIMKRLIRIPDISLVNIVAGKRIVPEYLQHKAQPEVMARELLCLIEDQERRRRMIEELATVKQALGDGRASERVAALVIELAK